MKKIFEEEARYGKEMTLGELGRFFDSVLGEGLPDDAKPRVRITMGGGIKSIEVDETHIVKPRPDRSTDPDAPR
jgi:hypothetical protein